MNLVVIFWLKCAGTDFKMTELFLTLLDPDKCSLHALWKPNLFRKGLFASLLSQFGQYKYL